MSHWNLLHPLHWFFGKFRSKSCVMPFQCWKEAASFASLPRTIQQRIWKGVFMQKTERFWRPFWKLFKKFKTGLKFVFHKARCVVNNNSYKAFPIVDVSDITFPRNIPIVTSIAPTMRIEAQKKAISTWLAQGFSPVSVNYPDEIEHLKPSFPEVRFLPVQMDSQPVLGKKRVFINELLHHAKMYTQQNDCHFAGIVNSDISLYKIDVDLLSRHASSSLVFSHRADVEKHQHYERTCYPYGVDAFFFRHEILYDFPQCRLALGEPWWDYAVPLWAMLHQRPVVACAPPLCFHVLHKINWSKDSYISMGEDIYNIFSPMLRKPCSPYPSLPEALYIETTKLPRLTFWQAFVYFTVDIIRSAPNSTDFCVWR